MLLLRACASHGFNSTYLTGLSSVNDALGKLTVFSNVPKMFSHIFFGLTLLRKEILWDKPKVFS